MNPNKAITSASASFRVGGNRLGPQQASPQDASLASPFVGGVGAVYRRQPANAKPLVVTATAKNEAGITSRSS